MGYKILGYIVWHGGKWFAGRWSRQHKRELMMAGAGVGVLLLAGAGAAVLAKRGGRGIAGSASAALPLD